MPQPRYFLDRFRPAPAPGAASRVGVPASQAERSRARLAPVLALLAATDEECERMVAAAGRDAALITRQAAREAAAISADAARRADAARQSTADEVVAAAREQADQTVAAAARRVRDARRFTGQEVSALASTAVSLILALGTEA